MKLLFLCLMPFALFAASSVCAQNAAKPDLFTGNLSVDYLRWVIQGRKGNAPQPTTAAYLESLRQAGVSAMEDYITFAALHPDAKGPDWRFYQENSKRLRAVGMRYGVYPWLHFAPQWFQDSDEYTPYVCLEHGKSTGSTSLWAPGTLRLFDRFYADLRRQIGDSVADIHLGMPADYGEVGFPIGMSSWLVPQEHAHRGFWCGDRYARADFREKMRGRYHTLPALNKAWGTDFQSWETLDYPPLHPPEADAATARRRWLDFVSWYADSQTEFARQAAAIIRKHYPNTPLQLKLGYGGEHVEYGVDNTGVARMAAKNGIIVRSTHGSLPPFFYKRFATACRFYGAKLLTEPPAHVDRDAEVQRLFNDATNLSTAYFDYPNNILAARDLFDCYLPWVQGERPYTPVAFFFPTSDHRLRAGQRLPEILFDQAAALRDITDYDLVDENLVRDGALRDHRLLVLFEGNWLEQQTLDAIAAWVRAGGTLALSDFGPIANIEGDTHTYQELLGPLAARRGDDSVLVPETSASAHMLLDIGAAGDERFLGAGWWNREQEGAATYRWTQAEASLRAPVNPEKDLLVTVTAEQHAVLDAPAHLRVNGKDAGALQFIGRDATLRVPAALLAGKRSALLTLVATPWRPSERLKDSKDARLLGLWVDKITVAQAAPGQEPGTLPQAQPAPGFRVDAARVLREFSRSVGKGRVVFFPLGKEAGPAYRELIRHLIYADGRPLQPTVDTEFDGIHAAVLESKILFLNPTEKAITKKVALRPEEFAGVPGPVPPRCTVSLDLQPHAIVAVQRADGKVLSPAGKGARPLEDLFWWNPNADIAECKLENGILRVRTQGDDPYLTHGRPFHQDARQYATLVLQVRTNIPGARLYWTSDTHPQLEDACSFGFALPADGAWHAVNVDLSKAANWDGDLRTLRLDLEGPAGYADFQAIRLERKSKS